jgi:hypothetical protein
LPFTIRDAMASVKGAGLPTSPLHLVVDDPAPVLVIPAEAVSA